MTAHNIILVDEHDNVIGSSDKLTVHQQGLRHRAFSVMLYRDKNNQREWLLQQRQANKYHCANLWTNSCCSHPTPTETILQAAQRRLFEELALHTPLTAIGKFEYRAEFNNGLIEHEIDHVLIGRCETDSFQPNIAEIADIRWQTLQDIEQALTKNPEQFTPWFGPVLALIKRVTL